MFKTIVTILVFFMFASGIYAQKLMIPESALFSDKANTLQPITILLIPGTPAVSFCHGYMGHFDKLPDQLNKYGVYGGLVSCILVDKKNKKILDNISCSWYSSNPEALKVISLDEKEKIKRAYLLIPLKAGKVFIEISMGKEKKKLGMNIIKNQSGFAYSVFNPQVITN